MSNILGMLLLSAGFVCAVVFATLYALGDMTLLALIPREIISLIVWYTGSMLCDETERGN